jgi:hypothetical protein
VGESAIFQLGVLAQEEGEATVSLSASWIGLGGATNVTADEKVIVVTAP